MRCVEAFISRHPSKSIVIFLLYLHLCVLLFGYQDGEPDIEALEREEERASVKDVADAEGGFKFDSPEHKQQLKEQRAQLWSWLKNVGGSMMREGISLTKISLPVCKGYRCED
jgi:hypothetical protein